jgi:hypothetical protein
VGRKIGGSKDMPVYKIGESKGVASVKEIAGNKGAASVLHNTFCLPVGSKYRNGAVSYKFHTEF